MYQSTGAKLCLALALAALPLNAQGVGQNQIQGLWLPNASPGASVAQTVGVTDIEVVYHRPAVNEREVWGTLVPYGQVWRTGANENTIIRFSTDVTVQGEPLAAGTYGLHTLPGEGEWMVIFSNDSTAWGSFSYDETRDALRVSAEPGEGPHQELLTFAFASAGSDSTTLELAWEKLRLPIEIAVDTETTVLANIRDQLKGLPRFGWQGWHQAASYCLVNEINTVEALTWIDSSIQAEERFDNLSVKSQLLNKTGEEQMARETMDRALGMAQAGQLHNYARQLQGQGKLEEALAIFERNAEQNPETWFVGVGLARGHMALGHWDEAVSHMKSALEAAPEAQKAYIQGLVEQLQNQKSI